MKNISLASKYLNCVFGIISSAALVAFTSFISSAALAASETKEFDSKGLNGVLIENNSGDISISTTESPKATVVASKNKFSEKKCSMSMDQSGNKLVIKVEKKRGTSSHEECNVDFQINVPKAVDLNLKVGAGKLKIQGIHGDLIFKVGSGDIHADGAFKKISGVVGSGKIIVKGLTGGGDFKTGSGDIDLTYTQSLLKGELDIKTGSGNATISFPKETKLTTSFKAGSGKFSSEIGDTPTSPFKVSMKAGVGDLKIKSH